MSIHCLLIVWLAFWLNGSIVHTAHTVLPIRRVVGHFIFPFSLRHEGEARASQPLSNFYTNTQQAPNEQVTKYSIIYQMMYTTGIAMGTPPQPFRAHIDITQSNFFVPSINCTNQTRHHEVEYCLYHLMYSSVSSSTYEPDLTPARLHYYGVYTRGNLSKDIVHIGGVSVKQQIFQEAIMWHPAYLIDWDEQYDTVLGLARLREINTYDDFDVPGLVENMVEQNTLDRNVFALRLPRTDTEEGLLILGGVDDAMAGSVIRIPLVDVPLDSDDSNFVPYASAGWVVNTSSLVLDAYLDQDPLTVPLPGYVAVLSNGYTGMMFPFAIKKRIASYLQWDDWLDDFPCEQRNRFPNFTIALGPQDYLLVLSPWQYMHEVINGEGEQRCLLPFHALYEDAPHPDYILLGAAFMAGLYTEFDLGAKTIGFANYTVK